MNERRSGLWIRDENAPPRHRFRQVDGSEPGLAEKLSRLQTYIEENVSSSTSDRSHAIPSDSTISGGPEQSRSPSTPLDGEGGTGAGTESGDQGPAGVAERTPQPESESSVHEGTSLRVESESDERSPEHGQAETDAVDGRHESDDSRSASGSVPEVLDSGSSMDQQVHQGTRGFERTTWY